MASPEEALARLIMLARARLGGGDLGGPPYLPVHGGNFASPPFVGGAIGAVPGSPAGSSGAILSPIPSGHGGFGFGLGTHPVGVGFEGPVTHPVGPMGPPPVFGGVVGGSSPVGVGAPAPSVTASAPQRAAVAAAQTIRFVPSSFARPTPTRALFGSFQRQ